MEITHNILPFLFPSLLFPASHRGPNGKRLRGIVCSELLLGCAVAHTVQATLAES